MNAEAPVIEIIIPNWNGIHLLVDCLDSLRRQSCRDFSVTVIDNGSRDDSVNRLEREYPEVKVIRFAENKGFSAAVNEGIRNGSSPWILLLNNDMEVDPDCLQVLKEQVQLHSSYDSFALRMVNFHAREFLDGAGDGFLRGGAGYRIGTMEKYGPPYNRDREVFGACAGAALYRKEFFVKVGLFDEDFFAYLEDVDINLRAKALGLRCYYLSSAVVYHIGSATSGSKINALTVRLSTRNALCVLMKNYPLSLFFRFFPVICIYQFFWFLFVIKKRKLLPYLQGVIQAASRLPKMVKKRRMMKQASYLPAEDFRKILSTAESEVICSIMARRMAAGKGNTLLAMYCRLFL
jgi:GT2 family glycosyltransferase